MPTAITAPYLALLNATVDDETFVTQTFRLMEADLRVLALSALADWDAAGLHAAAPILFQAVGALQRPAWGAWNVNRRSRLQPVDVPAWAASR